MPSPAQAPKLTLRPVANSDGEILLTFARSLADSDLLFLRRDIRRPDEVRRWLEAVARGQSQTTLALDDTGSIVGYVVLDRGALPWRQHVGEIRVLAAPSARQSGLVHSLMDHGYRQALDAGLEKLVVRLTPAQADERRIVEELGFGFEARLRDHVRDTAGATHDLLIFTLFLTAPGPERCDACEQLGPLGPSLEGRTLCWTCYGLLSSELGHGD